MNNVARCCDLNDLRGMEREIYGLKSPIKALHVLSRQAEKYGWGKSSGGHDRNPYRKGARRVEALWAATRRQASLKRWDCVETKRVERRALRRKRDVPRRERLVEGVDSAAPDLLFKQDWRQLAKLHPNAMTHVAVEDDTPAFDHAHREPLPGIALVDVEHQYLTHNRRLAADGDPLLVSDVIHDDVAKNSQDTFYWFYQSESLFFPASYITRAVVGSPGNSAP